MYIVKMLVALFIKENVTVDEPSLTTIFECLCVTVGEHYCFINNILMWTHFWTAVRKYCYSEEQCVM